MTRHTDEKFDLRQLDDDFAEAGDDERATVPDGKYEVIVDRVSITTARSTGNPMLKWVLRIDGPECRGRLLFLEAIIENRGVSIAVSAIAFERG
ncbi:MAG: DUF669 domain-containing protein [Candidatus Eremiobacteraeota bacterium]|nr:DUF669 domain-containing protein [Candidatus Eremiobacteraeota bacterium]